MFGGAEGAAGSVPREPWSSALGRYAAAVLGLIGVGAVLSVLLRSVMEPMPWGGLVGFSLLMGAFITWLNAGSADGAYRRRRIAPLALGAFVVYLGISVVVRHAGLDVPAPSAPLALAFGAVAVAVSARISTRLTRQVRSETGQRIRPRGQGGSRVS